MLLWEEERERLAHTRQDPVCAWGEKAKPTTKAFHLWSSSTCFFLYTGTCRWISKHKTHRKRRGGSFLTSLVRAVTPPSLFSSILSHFSGGGSSAAPPPQKFNFFRNFFQKICRCSIFIQAHFYFYTHTHTYTTHIFLLVRSQLFTPLSTFPRPPPTSIPHSHRNNVRLLLLHGPCCCSGSNSRQGRTSANEGERNAGQEPVKGPQKEKGGEEEKKLPLPKTVECSHHWNAKKPCLLLGRQRRLRVSAPPVWLLLARLVPWQVSNCCCCCCCCPDIGIVHIRLLLLLHHFLLLPRANPRAASTTTPSVCLWAAYTNNR